MGFSLVKIEANKTGEVIQSNDATIEAVMSNFVAYNTEATEGTFVLYSDTIEIFRETVPANGSYRLSDKFNIPTATELTCDTSSGVSLTASIYVGAVDVAGALTAAQQAAQDATTNGAAQVALAEYEADRAGVNADRAEAALGTTTNPVITGGIVEDINELTGVVLDGTNGSIQYKTITADITFTDSMVDGQSIVLRLVDGDSYLIGYPTISWVGGDTPELTSEDVLVFWKESSTLYGAYIGEL